MSKILCVAERANIKGVPEADRPKFRAEWEGRWKSDRRIRYILGLNSMVAGCQTRRRMNRLLALPVDVKTVNLLWPDCVPGTWDAAEGRVSALAIMHWIGTQPEEAEAPFDRIVLLGRRVGEAFALPADAAWGERFTVPDDKGWKSDPDGCVMILPHPSGRSTVLNDATLGSDIRAKVSRFVTGDVT